MDIIFQYSNLSFEDLSKLDTSFRAIFFLEYQKTFESICENSVIKRLLMPFYGRSLDEVYQKFEEIKSEFTSTSFLSGDFVQFYPMCRTHQSKSFFVE